MNIGGVIIDSGLADRHFVSKLTKPFRRAWAEITDSDRIHERLALSEEELDQMPTIVLVLSGYYEGSNDEVLVGDEPSGDLNDIAGYVGSTMISSNP